MVGMERAAFCNTGSEAVTAAIRVARTVTGRDKIAMFAGAYHGIFDEVLVRPTVVGGRRARYPSPPASLPTWWTTSSVLDYGNPESLQAIKAMGRELAAVLVEPVQSRRPDLQPREFLQELRGITTASRDGLGVRRGGHRLPHPSRRRAGSVRRACGHCDLRQGCRRRAADRHRRGSIRLPGRARWRCWRYGDESIPEVGVTFFAGTFVRHPLALAAARAVLLRLKEEGPELQRKLNLRTTRFVEMLNAHAEKVRAPVRVTHFGSWFCFNFPHDLPLASLFFAYMRAKGMHIWEGRPGLLTLAHSDADVERVITAFQGDACGDAGGELLAGWRRTAARAGRARGSAFTVGKEGLVCSRSETPGKYSRVREEASARD